MTDAEARPLRAGKTTEVRGGRRSERTLWLPYPDADFSERRWEALGKNAEATYERVTTAYRAACALHHRVTLWLPYPDADFSFEDYDEAVEYIADDLDPEWSGAEEQRATALAGITSFDVCAHCKQIEREQAESRGYEHAAWPCRSATALGIA